MNLEPNFPCCTGNFNQGTDLICYKLTFFNRKSSLSDRKSSSFNTMGDIRAVGWPKFVTNLAMTAPPRSKLQWAAGANDTLHSLVLAMLAPCTISTALGGGNVTANVTTNYPWGTTVNVSIASDAAINFAFRVPSWAGR